MNNEHRLRLCGGGFNEQDAQRVLHAASRLFDWPLDGLFDLGKSMNREDIIEMLEAEWRDRLKAAVLAEREACVKAIEDQIGWDMDDPESTAIKAIRSRGQA